VVLRVKAVRERVLKLGAPRDFTDFALAIGCWLGSLPGGTA
jgi:hypothetical protein